MNKEANDFSLECRSWADLAALVGHFSLFNGIDWLYRGVSNHTFGLRPKVGRPRARKRKARGEWQVPYELDHEKAVFAMFKQQALSHLSFRPQTDLEWLAIAQHHGVPTRLLDWTDSYLVAAWFATDSSAEEDGAIWITRGIRPIDPTKQQDPFDVKEPSITRAGSIVGKSFPI